MTARQGHEARQRRTQATRSIETRARLIEATLMELFENGYVRTTTADIADRAGVSRGALTHHFANKDDLVAQAVDHQLHVSTAEIRALATQMREETLALDSFLDRLWQMFSGRLFFVTLEHVAEARHNDPLRARLVPVVREFHASLDQIWRDFFRGSRLNDDEIEKTLNATLCLLRGMGLQSVLRDDPHYFSGLLDHWKAHLAALIEPAAQPKIRSIGAERA